MMVEPLLGDILVLNGKEKVYNTMKQIDRYNAATKSHFLGNSFALCGTVNCQHLVSTALNQF